MGHQKMNVILSITVVCSFLLCLSWAVPSEYSITGYDPKDLGSEDRLAQIFQQWKEKHGKTYKHAEEMGKRFEQFKKNLKYVIEKSSSSSSKNKKSSSVGLNRFADLSNEEFRAIYLSKVKKPVMKKQNRIAAVKSCDAPSSLDWRKKGAVTAIKDQGSCGSCWAFSSTGSMEGINYISTGELISLSEQELVDCDSTNYGCDGGYMDYAFEWVINNGGIDSESDYPYTSSDGYSGTCNTTKEETKVVSIDGYEDVDQSDSALLCAAVNQPVSVGIDASTMDFQLYTGGIYDGDCSSDPDDIDHAVLVVGYGSEGSDDYWIVKNSWGTSWGLEGYIYIKRNTDLEYGTCGINAMASYPTKNCSPSPSPYPSPSAPPPPPPSPPPPPPTPVTPPPPPPPSPSPSECGDFSYCPADQTCCCIYEFYGYCLIYGCCDYQNAVCCEGTEYCCPSDYPICDVKDGLCLKNSGDHLGIAAKKKKMAKHKLPWNKPNMSEKVSHNPYEWKMRPFAAAL